MDFTTAELTAKRLGCTVRAVQKWAKEGKIPYAYKDGRDWKIPTDAVEPSHKGEQITQYLNEPFPIIHDYQPGHVREYINNISNEDDRNMALCEYYYFTGEMKQSTVWAEPYLDSKNPILRSTAALFCIFANLCRGHLVKTHYAANILKETWEEPNQQPMIKAVNLLNSLIVKTQLHLPFENVPLMNNYIKYLDGGLKLFACYLMAYKAYLDKDYSRSLGIVETALNISEKLYPIPMIYLYLIEAMDLVNLLRLDEAVQSVEKAWKLAEPDGMFIPFVEHYNLLQGLVEKHFKRLHPKAYQKIIETTKQYNLSWFEIYDTKNETNIAKNLTHTEFTVAMLYSRNWRAKEIAAHMELSERTIMNYIALIYDKLQINSRKDLEKFMLK